MKGPVTGALVMDAMRTKRPRALSSPGRGLTFQYPPGVDPVRALGFEFNFALVRALETRRGHHAGDEHGMHDEWLDRANLLLDTSASSKLRSPTSTSPIQGPVTDAEVVQFMRDHFPDVFDDGGQRGNTFEYPRAMSILERIEFEHRAALSKLYVNGPHSELGDHFVDMALRIIAPYSPENKSSRHG